MNPIMNAIKNARHFKTPAGVPVEKYVGIAALDVVNIAVVSATVTLGLAVGMFDPSADVIARSKFAA